MTPAPVEKCRVLELGCGAGGNIIPLAFDQRGSSFLGIDLAATAIRQGQEMIRQLGLSNISLRHADVMTLSDLPEFDFVIAHGLFSWVPEVVRDRILEICRKNLAPQGVAYISYNTYPGCRLREITRDIMCFHTRDISDEGEKVRQSRAVINWIAESQQEENSYTTFVKEANTKLQKRDDSSIYHDDLADTNVPLYFHQFAKHANDHGLQFLSEADFFERSTHHGFAEEARRQLDQLGEENVLSREQYLDFLKGRSFRQTLLCHHEVELVRTVDSKKIENLLIKSQIKPTSLNPDLASDAAEKFCEKSGSSATTNQPLLKAALLYLGQIYPRPIGLAELVLQARLLIAPRETTLAEDTAMLRDMMLEAYEVGVIELHSHEPSYTIEPGDFPVASPIARLQLNHGNMVSTLLHNGLRLEDEIATKLLSLLDGSRDRAALTHELSGVLELVSTELTAAQGAESITAQLDQKLLELGRLGLLLA
jgi:methyltransferase-like protein/2-polyprenyl-3-methyl-5-hydroxy-6-metoxy-1,4-benzoquinol methylase